MITEKMEKRINKNAVKVANRWAYERSGNPLPGMLKEIFFMIGFGHDTGAMPVVSDTLMSKVVSAAEQAVQESFGTSNPIIH